MSTSRLSAGDWVEVRSVEEILATLDTPGALQSLPFMPEMLEHCGRCYRVSKLAHKTCDTIEGTGGRRLEAAVHLEALRCDGSAHGGCQALCLLFWKQAWLKPVAMRPAADPAKIDSSAADAAHAHLVAHAVQNSEDGREIYTCQTTELQRATRPLPWWSPSQYLKDLRSGNEKWSEFLRIFALWLWNLLPYRVRGGPAHPSVQPKLHGATPHETLELQPGEMVRIKSQQAIEETLNQSGKNRGLSFDVEMIHYCGGMYRVAARVERIIDEKTGRMVELPNDCILLDGVACRSRYSKWRRFCPRAIPHYWREIWLERVAEP